MKKWFTFAEDQHQGPFAWNDIQTQIEIGDLQDSDYIWTQGMSDWVRIGNLQNSAPESPKKLALIATPVPAPRPRAIPKPVAPVEAQVEKPISEPTFRKEAFFAALTLLFGLAGWWIYHSRHVDRFEFLNHFGISREELRELKAAPLEPLETQGPSFALGLVPSGPNTPYFYIATNLPTGARFTVSVEGISETLLDRTAVSESATITAKDGIAKTPPFRQTNGSPFPPGEYKISLIDPGSQPSLVATALATLSQSVLARKTYFLGGNKDADYDHLLRLFHERLREKAQSELLELKQFASTLENQLNETNSEFQDLLLRSPKPTASSSWDGIQNQLSQSLEKWATELKNDASKERFFYHSLYRVALQAGLLVNQVRKAQKGFFDSPREKQTLEVEIANVAATAQSTLLSLRTKITLAEKRPLSANGMPNREGL